MGIQYSTEECSTVQVFIWCPNTLLYNTLNYAIVSRHQINTSTVLYSPVLYCIKRENLWLLMLAMSHPRKLVSVLYKKRKFAQKNRQRTFQKLKSTLFLYVSSPDTR